MTPIMYFEWRRQPNFGASNNHIQQPYPKEKLWIGHSWDLNVWHLRLQENFKKDALFYEGTQNDRKIWILHYRPRDFYP